MPAEGYHAFETFCDSNDPLATVARIHNVFFHDCESQLLAEGWSILFGHDASDSVLRRITLRSVLLFHLCKLRLRQT
jgi:hypothetical protein